MTRLEAMLERAAEAQPINFDTGDIRRRVRRRRRTRRAAAGIAAVVVVVGVFGLAHMNGLHRVDRLAGSVHPSPVGRWEPVTISGIAVAEHQHLVLVRIEEEIQTEEDALGGSGGLPRDPGQGYAASALARLYTRRADLITGVGLDVDLRGDGTFDGHDDMCGKLAGRWHIDGTRLVVDMKKGKSCVGSAYPTSLSRVLRAHPTVRFGRSGTLELRSSAGSASLQRG